MEINQTLLDGVIHSIPGDFAVYRINEGRFETIYVSSTVPALSGMTTNEYQAMTEADAGTMILEIDRPYVMDNVAQILAGRQDDDITYRIYHKTAGHVWIHAKARTIGMIDNKPAIVVLFLNTSAETERFADIVDHFNGIIYVIDRTNYNLFYVNKMGLKNIGSQYAVDYSHHKCYELFCHRSTICPWCSVQKMKNGTYHTDQSYSDYFDMWFRVDCHDVQWFGRKAVIVYSTDITNQQREQDVYTHMYQQLAEASINSLGTFHLNLTTNWCGQGKSPYPHILRLQEDGTVDGFFKRIAAGIVDTKIQSKFLETVTREIALESFYNGQTTMSAEFPVRLADGTICWVLAYFNMIQNPLTGDIEAITNSTDITKRKKNEAIIEVITKEKFDYIGVLNLRRHTFEYYTLQEDIFDAKLHHPVDCEQWRLYVRSIFIDQDEWEHFDQHSALTTLVAQLESNGEYTFSYPHTQDGITSLRQIQYNWLNKDNGEILVIQSDITAAYAQEQKRIQQTQEALREAKQANVAKTNFVSRISHDIRTPISAISNMTEFAFEDMDDKEKLQNDLQKIRTSNEFLLSLINDILDISKIDSGKIELNPEPYPYDEYISHIKNMFEPLCKEKGVTFVISPRPQKVGTMVADKIRINQITLNVISNAIKYTPSGGRVTYTSHTRDLPDDRILFSFEVTDTGIGMSKDFQQKMFASFTQEHDNPYRPQGLSGTGLGLFIVKHIVDLMGGTLAVKSQLGQGTSIFCEIPFPDATKDDVYRQHPIKTPIKRRKMEPLQGKVLLVEDNEINTEIAIRILESFGLTVVHAINGIDAVDVFEKSMIDEYRCIIMDIQMPLMNGYEATKKIRSMTRPDAKIIPIIAMTADAFAEAVEASRRAGMDEHVTKPLDPDYLREVLKKYLV